MEIFKVNDNNDRNKAINRRKKRLFKMTPARIMLIGFLSLIIVGAILLYLPISSNEGKTTTFTESLFTSTSAVCVTGLVVVDSAVHWSLFGKVVILLLIQTGALGIMSVVTLFSIITGKNLGLLQRLTIQESTNNFSLSEIVQTFKGILLITLSIEFTGALIISFKLVPIYGLVEGIGKSIFHSISAFCNAGFDLFGSENGEFVSLTDFNNSPLMLITTSFLIIIGGLGFIVWNDIASTRKFSRLTLHTKIVLTATLVLIVFGAVTFFIFEMDNTSTIGNMSLPHKILNSYFHSVSTRTAGFNAISTADTKQATNFFTIILMFIGAAPGSTAGGIKVTTFFTILLTVIAFTRGKEDVQIFERRISNSIKTKAISIMFLGGSLIMVVVIAMMFNNEGDFLKLLYEATSAFGTVGLSTGITPELNTIDRYLIMLTMFVGRLGPFTAVLAFMSVKDMKSFSYRYPEGKITVG